MTSREAVRTAVVIGGLWLIFSALASVPEALAALSRASASYQGSEESRSGMLLWSILPVLVGIFLFGVLPGIYIIETSQSWANRLVRTDDLSTSIEPSLVLAVGIMIFGFSLGVNGAISMVVNLLGLLSQILAPDESSIFRPDYLVEMMRGILSIAAGFLSFRWGSRGVLRAA